MLPYNVRQTYQRVKEEVTIKASSTRSIFMTQTTSDLWCDFDKQNPFLTHLCDIVSLI